MKIKRYVAPNMRSAIQMVRDEQGPDAVILSNRQVAGGVEVVAAVDYDAKLVGQMARDSEVVQSSHYPPQAMNSAYDDEPADDYYHQAAPAPAAARREARPTPPRPVLTSPSWQRETRAHEVKAVDPRTLRPQSYAEPLPDPVLDQTEALRLAIEAAKRGEKPAVPPRAAVSSKAGLAQAPAQQVNVQQLHPSRSGGAAANSASNRSRAAAPRQEKAAANQQDTGFNAMREELQSLRKMMMNQLNGLAWSELKNRHPLYVPLMQNMLQLGLSSEMGKKIVDEIQLTDSMTKNWQQAMKTLAMRIEVTHDNVIEQGGIIALVGPSGVGKTTTAAKLAARYALRHGSDRVALVTIDNFRIGAYQQLRTFGRILGSPVHVAQNSEELQQTLDLLQDFELVIIDTAGVGYRQQLANTQLQMLMEMRQQIDIYALLSASSQLQSQEETVRAYSASRLAGLMLTKLDESTALGGSLTVAIQNRLPIAYLCDGQQVPEDIQPARSNKLVNLSVSYLQERQRELPDEETVAFCMGGAQ
ncbi:MAG: flagellar biosynthesis protein FlhF [Gammaproteobacteria bacterium]|nr:flagellar biosynthesis protein FlhF [Gammaproteobacteria bacterium]